MTVGLKIIHECTDTFASVACIGRGKVGPKIKIKMSNVIRQETEKARALRPRTPFIPDMLSHNYSRCFSSCVAEVPFLPDKLARFHGLVNNNDKVWYGTIPR